jgi:hypothetical protein
MSEVVSLAIAFTTGVVGPILVILIKNRLEKQKPKPDMVAEALKVGELITNKIEYIKEEVRADRVWITQFHNGGHFYPTGKSMAKFSVIYETVSSGASSIQSNFQNIPVNLFSKSINRLLENDVIEIADFTDDSLSTYGLKYLAETTGSKSEYLFAIKTLDGKFIGSLGIEFTKKPVKLEPRSINSISVHASAIGGVLMNHLDK